MSTILNMSLNEYSGICKWLRKKQNLLSQNNNDSKMLCD